MVALFIRRSTGWERLITFDPKEVLSLPDTFFDGLSFDEVSRIVRRSTYYKLEETENDSG